MGHYLTTCNYLLLYSTNTLSLSAGRQVDDLLFCVTSLAVLGNKAFSLLQAWPFRVCILCNRQWAAFSKKTSHLAGRGAVLNRSTSPWSPFCPCQLANRPLTGYPYPFLLHCFFFSLVNSTRKPGPGSPQGSRLSPLASPASSSLTDFSSLESPRVFLRSSGWEVWGASGALYPCLCFLLCIGVTVLRRMEVHP